ncbi:ADR254Wp [Eremothecium gossypii ATCC 10895]|uniref:ADR254Wp n=1 Tax=Eremothecium gossypii (strain ATCC 10895 / CBS 109.51 / FGSC 9923 / NRRL Y-1056) TaxID=284811 RepID=Q759M2_EREGS|nr:ADR254Wp [Eremothecium gossypii ATCC 10895]AAS52174.2 ADR254Wp [Eremothecium gossypii ATCC 10895]AEY96473.1 FADR254Wp [Eremothecium gossypii FDAG1]
MSSYTCQNNVPSSIPLAEYLFHRLRQLGVTTVFGLPSDYNMFLLDGLENVADMHLCCNTNELNASYAADGYARMQRLSCLVSTFGVGELSVVNGIAGSFAEHVAVLLIVGMPPASAQRRKLLLHHTLGNGDYDVFRRLASDICTYSTVVRSAHTAAEVLDHCIARCYRDQKPVYCGVPINLAEAMLPSAPLDVPLPLLDEPCAPLDELVALLLDKIYAAKHPVLVVDACVARHGCMQQLQRLAQATDFPVCCTPMGKGIVDEQGARFAGVYVGSLSAPQVREVVDFADFVLVVGALTAEFCTSSFHFAYKPKNIALLHARHARVAARVFPDAPLRALLALLLQRLDPARVCHAREPVPEPSALRVAPNPATPLRHEWLWARLSRWFAPGDILVSETGTSAFGVLQTRLPPGVCVVSQPLWGSVGYSVGACLGVLVATRAAAPPRRVVLFVGDGALQLTVQELSTMVRLRLAPLIFVLNNRGYSADRLLNRARHRANARYYDVQPWHNLALAPAFGASAYDPRAVTTVGELDALLSDPAFAQPSVLKMVEVALPSMDGPPALLDTLVPEHPEHADHKRPKLV